MSNLEELNYTIISELRDQLEAKEQMIKMLKEKIKIYERELEELLKMLKTVKEFKE